MKSIDWDEFELDFDSRAPINTPGYRRELKGNRVTLFGTGANLSAKTLARMYVKTEKSAQAALTIMAYETRNKIQDNIEEMRVIDTGATKASVFVLLPPAWKEQRRKTILSNETAQRNLLTGRSVSDYLLARQAARFRRPSLNVKNASSFDEVTGRVKSTRDFDQHGITWKDIPFNPLGTVARKNLYVAVGVGTWYAIFPHEGINQGAYGPRRFAAPEIEKMQQRFAKFFKEHLESELRRDRS